jgi:hypothetical protein
MDRTRTRLRVAGFAVALAVLFGGGYAVGAQFPVDGTPAHEMDHDDGSHSTSTPEVAP